MKSDHALPRPGKVVAEVTDPGVHPFLTCALPVRSSQPVLNSHISFTLIVLHSLSNCSSVIIRFSWAIRFQVILPCVYG